MRIGDIIAKIGELITAVEASDTAASVNTTPIIINTGSAAPVNTQPIANDKEPEDLFLPPLQQKQELLKKAVGVENVYDNGNPEQQDIVDRIKQLSGVPVAAIQELSNDNIIDD